ncbi:MAG: 50S ribosomal protein L24 [Lentisphaerae bacterium]|nr:50S ribosomal protein L24 [Lentisphaerota bacterium]
MSVSRIKKDDVVIVNTGRNRGKTGKVLAIDPKRERAVVEGVNLVKKTVRKSQQFPEGKILDVPASIHLSNLMPYDPQAKKGVRISRVREDGKGVRVAKGTGHRFE